MFRIASLLGLIFGASAAMADDPCPDLWFSKAAIFAQGGYCQSSPLGEALFGSDGCSNETPTLPDYLEEQLTRIAQLEDASACEVDADAAELEIWQIETRKTLVIQPIMSERAKRCIMKAPTSLRVAPSPEADQLGWLERGDLILIQHDPAGGADFAARVRRGDTITEDIGWFSSSQCKPL